MKPGPGFLDHLAQARGPGTKSALSDNRARTQVLLIALLGSVGVGWFCLDRGPTAGVTVPMSVLQEWLEKAK